MINVLKEVLNLRSLVLCLCLLLMGLSAGVFFGCSVPISDKAHFISLMQNSSVHPICVIMINAAALLLIFIAGISVYGFPLAFIILFSRSFSIGFCDALLLYNIDNNGIGEFITSFLLPQTLFCCIYLLAASSCTTYALSYIHKK